MIKIFDVKGLDKLYKKGKLDRLLNKYPRHINPETWIGSGSEAAAFFSNNQVIKVCPKHIRFFATAGHSSAQRFQDQINQLQPFMVAINEIIYEDKRVIAYTQDRCKLLKDKNYKSPYVAMSFLQLIIFMLEKNQLVSDIGIHNLGLLQGHVVVFDYHGLHPITANGRILHRKWWKRPIRNLSNFLSFVDHKGKGFSSHYKEFLKDLPHCRTEKHLHELIRLLYKCLRIMMDEIRLKDKHWKKILSRDKFLEGEKAHIPPKIQTSEEKVPASPKLAEPILQELTPEQKEISPVSEVSSVESKSEVNSVESKSEEVPVEPVQTQDNVDKNELPQETPNPVIEAK